MIPISYLLEDSDWVKGWPRVILEGSGWKKGKPRIWLIQLMWSSPVYLNKKTKLFGNDNVANIARFESPVAAEVFWAQHRKTIIKKHKGKVW